MAKAADVEQHARPLGLNTTHCRIAVGCDKCRGTGYSGRCLIAEWRDMTQTQESPQTGLPARDLDEARPSSQPELPARWK